jgi:hypothetical protein
VIADDLRLQTLQEDLSRPRPCCALEMKKAAHTLRSPHDRKLMTEMHIAQAQRSRYLSELERVRREGKRSAMSKDGQYEDKLVRCLRDIDDRIARARSDQGKEPLAV